MNTQRDDFYGICGVFTLAIAFAFGWIATTDPAPVGTAATAAATPALVAQITPAELDAPLAEAEALNTYGG